MAYTLVQHTAAKSNSGNGFTSSSVDTTGGDFIALVLAEVSGGATTISDSKSNTWTQKTAQSFVGQVSIWYAFNATTGTGHTFTTTGTNTFPSICVAVFSGGKLTQPFDVENGNTAAAATSIQTNSVTPSENNEFIIAGYSCNDDRNSTIAIDSPFTLEDHIGADSFGSSMSALGYSIQTTATARNPTFSWTSSEYCQAAIATFKAAAAAGIPPGLGTVVGLEQTQQAAIASMMR